ncbi:integrase [Mycobacterium phage Paito]|uniref:Integrase n=1 Tax=Mycobacterium phage Paito TaxID=2315544 RepID=A0A386KK90_9CAUD|nr:integrase [Mycobacterium phage Paito]AYD84617.1 integrase [Mycobacterium phage Paito]
MGVTAAADYLPVKKIRRGAPLHSVDSRCQLTNDSGNPGDRSGDVEGSMRALPRKTGPAPQPLPEAWRPLITRYVTHLASAGYPQTTLATRTAHLRRISRGVGVSPENLTGESLRDFFAKQTHWARETRRGYRNTAVSFFTWAHDEGHLATNPARALPSVKPSPPRPRPVPDRAYCEAMMAATPRVMLMLRLADEVGLRRAEVAQVHTDDLSEGYSGYELLVHGKGGKIRILPISDELAELVAQGPAGHTPGAPATGYLFPGNDNGHLSPSYVGKLCAAAIPGIWTMHKLRHRFAKKAYDGTRDLRALQTMLGHSSVATTEIYVPVEDDAVRAVMMAARETPGRRRGGNGTFVMGAVAAGRGESV